MVHLNLCQEVVLEDAFLEAEDGAEVDLMHESHGLVREMHHLLSGNTSTGPTLKV